MIDNNVALSVSVSGLVKLKSNYNATATLVNEVVKINIERNSEQIYVTIFESSPET